MKVVCIKSRFYETTSSGRIYEYTEGKVYPILRVDIDGDINIYTRQPSKKYILQNDNDVLCAWSYGPGNGTLFINFAEYFCDMRTFNLNQLGV